MAILAVKNVTKRYKNQTVLEDISLTIDTPGIWALVGPNGVGKTTFLNVLSNILPADSGKIELVGKTNKDFNIFKEVSFMQDNSILFEYLTGYDHLRFVCDVYGIPTSRIKEVTQYVGMTSYTKKIVGNYSLGMKQHLLLAMAIINKPKLLFLDEPLNGLDPSSAILVRKILRELAEQGTTVILSSHNLAEIDRVTKKILFLKDKKIIEVNMLDYEKTYYYIQSSNNETAKLCLEQQGILVEEVDDKLKIHLEHKTLSEVFASLKVQQVEILDIEKEITGSEKIYEQLFEQ